MESHHIEYMAMNYPNEPNRAMTPYDVKAANLINKIKNKYSNYIESRRHTIMIEKAPLVEIKPKEVIVKEQKAPVSKPPTNTVAVATCKAIVIRTNAPCGRKLKPGCEFCGFHKK
jgi:hypothetical protein